MIFITSCSKRRAAAHCSYVCHAASLAGQPFEASPSSSARPQSSLPDSEKDKIKEAKTQLLTILMNHFTLERTLFKAQVTDWCVFTSFSQQEYEQKLARLQAEYNAEQQSRAKLQEDIAVLLSEYKSRLSEKPQTGRGSSVLKNGRKLSNPSKDQCKKTLSSLQCLSLLFL